MRIIFIHNKAMWYRIPFFKLLSYYYNIDFLFTHEKEIKKIENIKYKIFKNYLGIAFSIFPELLKSNYDLMIIGCCSNLSELFETLISFIIGKLRKKKIIIWSEQCRKPEKKYKSLGLPIMSFMASYSDAYIVPGKKHQEFAISLGCQEEKVFMVPNIGSISNKNQRNKHKNINLKNKKIILFVGRLIELKGVHYLIEAFGNLKKDNEDVYLILIGAGEYEKKLKKLSKELEIEEDIHFVGWVDNEELSTYYLMSSLFVIPSIYTDAAPLVLHEAVSYGKPIIASDACCGAYDVIKNGINGYIIPRKDADALYSAMKRIISNSNLEKQMSINSTTISKKLTYEEMVKEFNLAISYIQ